MQYFTPLLPFLLPTFIQSFCKGMEKNLPQSQIPYVSSFYPSAPPCRMPVPAVGPQTSLHSNWLDIFLNTSALPFWELTGRKVIVEGHASHTTCSSPEIMPWNTTSHLLSQSWRVRKVTKGWASSCTYPAPPLCSHLDSLLFLELKPAMHASPEWNFKKQMKINLWDAALTSGTHNQAAGAAQAVLLWGLCICSGKATGHCHTSADDKYSSSHLTPIPTTWRLLLLLSFVFFNQ